jgi:hypothetical protein
MSGCFASRANIDRSTSRFPTARPEVRYAGQSYLHLLGGVPTIAPVSISPVISMRGTPELAG